MVLLRSQKFPSYAFPEIRDYGSSLHDLLPESEVVGVPGYRRAISTSPVFLSPTPTCSHLLPTPGYNAVRLELAAEAETQPALAPVKVSGRVRRGHNGRRSSRRTRRSPANAWPRPDCS